MNKLPLLGILLFSGYCSTAQVCTVTTSTDWPGNGTGITCAEGGNAVGKTTLVIPAGVTVNFNDNADTWTGTSIEVSGVLTFGANVIVNSSLVVKDGGVVNILGKLSLGEAAPCSYNIVVQSGGTVDVAGTGSDRLTICGTEVMKGQGQCNDCGGTYSGQCPYNDQPYCEPAGGFTGPTGFDDTGFNPSLPVTLLYFKAESADETVTLRWATTMEEDFARFIVQRSKDGSHFEDVAEVNGKGFDVRDITSEYVFEDQVPLLGTSYYRLKAVDLDDSFEYFPVRMVRMTGTQKMAIYPNPSTGEVIAFRTNFSAEETDRVILTDQLGIEILNVPARAAAEGIPMEQKLRTGIYLLRYLSADFERTERVIVRN